MKLGSKHRPESLAKISAARKGRSFTTGTTRTPEQRERMSQAAKRRMQNPEQRGQLLRAGEKAAQVRRLPEGERLARAKVRAACKRMLRRILTMVRGRKDATTEQILGYTQAELRGHLEAQFKPGMCWSRRESFHIDHKTPVAEFLRRGIVDPAVINALSNLTVLTPAENRSKSDRLNWMEVA